MAVELLRALVVDDESPIRKLISMALAKQGFACDLAADGDEAERLALGARYDAVVTDLRMPNKHGHALAVSLLEMEQRPLIVIHTGLLEPALAKDLLARGVDDILFKPIDFSVLASKVKSMVERRAQGITHPTAENEDLKPRAAVAEQAGQGAISSSQLADKLAGFSRIMPISKGAIDVYTMTLGDNREPAQIAAAIELDASLAAEVLRIANSPVYSPLAQRVNSLEHAVTRLGQKRVGELALAAQALSTLTPTLLPWMDTDLIWRRSMAAGMAMEAMIEAGGHHAIAPGLLLSAIMYPLGRVALGVLFPRQYERMTQQCRQEGEALQHLERQLFPSNHAHVLSTVLRHWNVPAAVFLPLKLAVDDYPKISRLSEPSRTQAELVKVALFLGRLAARRWENWDTVEIPPPSVLQRLRVGNPAGIIEQASLGLESLCEGRTGKAVASTGSSHARKKVIYCSFSGIDSDLLLELLPAMGLEPELVPIDELAALDRAAIVNCIDTPPARYAARHSKHGAVVVTGMEYRDIFSRFTQTVAVPTSYSRLQNACRSTAQNAVEINVLA